MKTLCMNLIHFDFLILCQWWDGVGVVPQMSRPLNIVPPPVTSYLEKWNQRSANTCLGTLVFFLQFHIKRWAIIANYNVTIVVILEVVCKLALCYFEVWQQARVVRDSWLKLFALRQYAGGTMPECLSEKYPVHLYYNKRRGIGQYPIFSRTPYFSAKKHTTVFLKVEVLGQKGSFSLSSMQPIKDTNPKKLNIQTLPMTHTIRKPQRFRLWICHLCLFG